MISVISDFPVIFFCPSDVDDLPVYLAEVTRFADGRMTDFSSEYRAMAAA